MRPYIYLILFLLVLMLPFGLRRQLSDVRPKSPGAAAARLTVITPHNQDIRREFARAFADWHQRRYHQAVQLDYLTPGGTNDIKRQLESTYNGYRDRQTHQLPADLSIDIDVVFGGGDFFIDSELKPMGILQPMALDAQFLTQAFPQSELVGVKLLDSHRDASGKPAPMWVGTCLSAFGLIYNADLYRALQLPPPTQWHDLADPRLNDMVALADPTHSATAAIAFMMVIQRSMADYEQRFFQANPAQRDLPKAQLAASAPYQAAIAAGWKQGMGQLLLIAANSRYFSDSSPQPPYDVSNGQAAAGMTIDFYGRVYEEIVGPGRCKVVMPVAATAITPDPVAILYGVKGDRLKLATHFVEFLLSPEGQLLWILKLGQPGGPSFRALRRPPIRRDLYANRRGWADDIDPFRDAGNFNQRAEWMVLFGDTRPLWSAAWIDSRQDLKRAYARILAIDNVPRRRQLLSQLMDLPITMGDVQQLRNQRKEAEGRRQGEEWKALQRIQWGKKFRAHYHAIRRAADEPYSPS